MSTALKHRYSPEFFQTFCKALNTAAPEIDTSSFLNDVFSPSFEQAELKGRMTLIVGVLKHYLPDHFPTACEVIIRTVSALKKLGVGENFEYMFLPEYVAIYGIEEFDVATSTLAAITGFTSAEFAVRPFILKQPADMIALMKTWSKHKDAKVRRLSCEGARPRLPWAMSLPDFIKDPTPVLPILEELKNDVNEAVRRSVANHLNDISKDNPEIAKRLALKWLGKSEAIDAVVKHGCRSLLKAGDPDILKLFNLHSDGLTLRNFDLVTKSVSMGERLHFNFSIKNESKEDRLVRIEYLVHLLKKNGDLAPKIFKISEREVSAGQEIDIERSHHFKPITTRVYYSGTHKLSVVLNGKVMNEESFDLLC